MALLNKFFIKFILFLVSYHILFLFLQFVYILRTVDNQVLVLADIKTVYLVTPVLS